MTKIDVLIGKQSNSSQHYDLTICSKKVVTITIFKIGFNWAIQNYTMNLDIYNNGGILKNEIKNNEKIQEQ